MQEFLMWGNCTNQCDFCWQCKKRDETIFLNKEEMISCIEDTLIRLDEINDGDDVLIVGGEILATYHEEVNPYLHKLIDKCVKMLSDNKIRFLYVNTNLIYKDRTNLVYLFEAIRGYEDRLFLAQKSKKLPIKKSEGINYLFPSFVPRKFNIRQRKLSKD